ncbi:hypothetical protein C8F04DRAFT_1272802 [Mycena alexandri]|uniref:Uncharacterized protein n=1 Tax=Mycena alexandri TaxID=1745969 RepID=A0AAD6S8Q7_9AGAR|nr:hypothetical protein C8F04DRAFT_1272802 [Mycena alexandri]
MSVPDSLTDPNTTSTVQDAASTDDFGRALSDAIQRYLALPPREELIMDDLIPDGPSQSWDDPSWQLGRIDTETRDRDWANAAPLAATRFMGSASRRDPLEDGLAEWDSVRRHQVIEIVRDVATDAEAEVIERRSELLNNLFWDPPNMPTHFRESVQHQMALMGSSRRARVTIELMKPRKVRLFDEEFHLQSTHCSAGPEATCNIGAEDMEELM